MSKIQMVITPDETEDALMSAGVDLEMIRNEYSGRGMYGKTCFGIVCTLPEAMKFIVSLTMARTYESVDQEACFDQAMMQMAGGVRVDSMGLQQIYYWPDVIMRDLDNG